jgi:PhnB protein
MKIPEGYQVVMPYLILKGCGDFMDFSQRVFGATVGQVHRDDDGRIMHAEIKIQGSTIMMGESTADYRPRPGSLYIIVGDADQTYQKAIAAGATTLHPPEDKEYGRSAGVEDPFGNAWWITA